MLDGLKFDARRVLLAACEPAALRVACASMNSKAKFRLAALGLAAGLMGVLIALATILSQKQAGELRAQLQIVDSESDGIAEHFKDSLREVNNIRLRYIDGPRRGRLAAISGRQP